MQIVIFGGGGFIGGHLAQALARRGHTLFIPARDRERVKSDLILLPATNVYAYHPGNMSTMKRGLAGADVMVNLTGILNENARNLYDQVHAEHVRILMDGCEKYQVPRVVHVSALGAAPGAPSKYLRSKAKGEQIIKNNDSLSHAIVRPSVVFGSGDSFVNRFAPLIRRLPLLPLPCAAARFQPIYIDDLVALLTAVIEDDSYHNRILHAGGAEELTLEEIIRRIARAMNQSARLLPMSSAMSYAFAAVAEKIPFVNLITRDNCRSMQLSSVCPKGGNDAASIVGDLTTFDSGLAAMTASGSDYGVYRHTSGRR